MGIDKTILLKVEVTKEFPETGEVDIRFENALGEYTEVCVWRDLLLAAVETSVLRPFPEMSLTS